MKTARNKLLLMTILAALPGCQAFKPETVSENAFSAAGSTSTDLVSPEDTAAVQVGIGRMYEQQNATSAAINAYQAALRHTPDNPEAYWRLAVLQDQAGDFESGASNFQKALSLDPQNVECLCDYGYCLYLQGQWVPASTTLNKVLEIDSAHRRAHNILGVMDARSNRFSEATFHFQRAGCSFAECEENLAFALVLDNRLQEARDHYERALILDPVSPRSQDNLELLDPVIAARAASQANTARLR